MTLPQAPRLARRHGPVMALKYAYWALHRDPRLGPHLWRAVRGAAANALRLRRRRDGRGRLAIALIEHMGDIVAAEPIARLARATYPDHRLVWIARAPFADLAAVVSGADEVVTVQCLTEWILLWRLDPFDIVWDLHLHRRQCPHCCVPLEKTDPAGAGLPTLDNFLRYPSLLAVQCHAANLPPLRDGPRLTPPPAAAAAVDRLGLPPRYVVLHARANDAERDWRAAAWPDLVAGLLAAWDGAVVEVGLAPVAIQAEAPRARDLCGKLSILETAEVIRRADLFIGIDSGPAHLANAVGTPGVALLGDLAYARRRVPFSGGYADGTRAVLLHADGPAAALPVATVLQAALGRLADTAGADRQPR